MRRLSAAPNLACLVETVVSSVSTELSAAEAPVVRSTDETAERSSCVKSMLTVSADDEPVWIVTVPEEPAVPLNKAIPLNLVLDVIDVICDAS